MPNITLAAINERNANFWTERSALTQSKACDPATLEIALESLSSCLARGFPVNQIPSFDDLFDQAAKNKKISLKHFARRGGKAPKPNALQEVIEEIVEQNPNINQPQFLKKLAEYACAGVVVRIDKPSDRVLECDPLYIHYIDEDGRTRTAPLSGLKDRLSRAKRKTKKESENSH